MVRQAIEVTTRVVRRVAVLAIGSTVLLFGITLIVLPGPAILVIPLGLGILGLEFAWARRWLVQVREHARAASERFTQRAPADDYPGRIRAIEREVFEGR